VVKVTFGKEKGKFKLTGWNGEVDYLKVKNGKIGWDEGFIWSNTCIVLTCKFSGLVGFL